MKKVIRKKFSSEFKAKLAIEAIKEQKTIVELALQYEIHPTQVQQWKKQFLENAQLVFEDKKGFSPKDADQESKLYEQIGKLQVQNEWLKKKLS